MRNILLLHDIEKYLTYKQLQFLTDNNKIIGCYIHTYQKQVSLETGSPNFFAFRMFGFKSHKICFRCEYASQTLERTRWTMNKCIKMSKESLKLSR